jgi:hypothetical protein
VDTGTPLLVVSHPVAELPGMMALARYLAGKFPQVPVSYVPVEYPWRVVG